MPGREIALRMEQTFAAPPERVFAAWTEPEVLRRWWAAGPDWTTPWVEVDVRAGGHYRLAMAGPGSADAHVVTGEYLEVDPPRRLVYTWRWETPDDAAPDATTLVTVEFRDAGERGTQVVLTHAGFPDAGVRDRHGAGWRGCLDNLDARVVRVQEVP